jgi:RNA polymerase sigma factor (sigma-70 family)
MDDSRAIELALAGQEAGFRAIFENHASFLMTHAVRILRDTPAAEDAVQETFASGFKSLKSFKGDSRLRTWFYRILYNHSLKQIRRENPAVPAGLKTFQDSSAVKSEQTLDVAGALDKLPEKDRSVLIMAYWDELPVSEIAKILGVTEGNAKVMLFRARKRFSTVWMHSSEKGDLKDEL